MPKPLPADFPRTVAEWETLAAKAPSGVPYDPATDAYDPNDPQSVEAFWKDAVLVRSGGPAAVRAALAAKRGRGPGKRAAKALVSLRIPQDTLTRWKATGPGWQTRMAEALDKAL